MKVPGHCELLVVGAGPAGSRAAAVAAREGVSTILIDAKTRIGEQPHCGEFVPEKVFTDFYVNRVSAIQRVEFMETRILQHATERSSPAEGPGTFHGTSLRTLSPGYVVDRVRFDRELARDAAAQGAVVLSSARLVDRHADNWIVKSGPEHFTLRPRLIVAADGALSSVARLLGLTRPNVLAGLQVEVPISGSLDGTFIFLHPSIVGGYGWLFPKGNVANAGVGVAAGASFSARRTLEFFLDILLEARMIREGRLAASGGVIPVSGPRESLVLGNVIFCGDAAGLTHPITGAGIPQAIFSGDRAGNAAAAALKTGSSRSLAEYEAEVFGLYRGVLTHASAKRAVMEQKWSGEDFTSLCEETWIAFKGYRRRVRASTKHRGDE